MAFATVSRIYRIRNYAEAERMYNGVKPIRGSKDIRPIGARRDAHWYRINRKERLTGGYDYEAILYDTPVVTFYPDNTIKVKTGGYATATTMQFIDAVLGISSGRQRGSCVFRIGGRDYVFKGRNVEFTLTYTPNGFTMHNEETHKQWTVNRTAANNVRSRYSEFRKYFKGFLSLRTEVGHRWGHEVTMVRIGVQELVDLLGTTTRDSWNKQKIECINVEPFYSLANKQYPNFQQKAEVYYDLIRNDQDEEAKQANFYKAAVGYFAGYRSSIELNSSLTDELSFDVDSRTFGVSEAINTNFIGVAFGFFRGRIRANIVRFVFAMRPNT